MRNPIVFFYHSVIIIESSSKPTRRYCSAVIITICVLSSPYICVVLRRIKSSTSLTISIFVHSMTRALGRKMAPLSTAEAKWIIVLRFLFSHLCFFRSSKRPTLSSNLVHNTAKLSLIVLISFFSVKDKVASLNIFVGSYHRERLD